MTAMRFWREAVLATAIVAVPAAMVWDMTRRPARAILDRSDTIAPAPASVPRMRGAADRAAAARAMPPGFSAIEGARLIETTDDGAGGRQSRFLVPGSTDALRSRLVADMDKAGLRLDGVVATEAMTLIAGARDGAGAAGAPHAVQAMLSPARDGIDLVLSWTVADAAAAARPSDVEADATLRAEATLVPGVARR